MPPTITPSLSKGSSVPQAAGLCLRGYTVLRRTLSWEGCVVSTCGGGSTVPRCGDPHLPLLSLEKRCSHSCPTDLPVPCTCRSQVQALAAGLGLAVHLPFSSALLLHSPLRKLVWSWQLILKSAPNIGPHWQVPSGKARGWAFSYLAETTPCSKKSPL